MRFSLLLAFALSVVAAAACYTGPDIGAASSVPVTTTEPTEAVPNGLPCEITALLEKNCASCHGSPPRSGADTTLTTREALLGSFQDRPLADVLVERLQDTESPMPPEGLLSDDDVATFTKWVQDGMPEGTCDGPAESNEAPELTCTSGREWTDGDEGDEEMLPGEACIACHTKENKEHGKKEAPVFSVAGTLYPKLHERDDCYGLSASGIQIVIEGADGKKTTLTPNRTGNFESESPIAKPYRASVIRNGKVRKMKTAQKDGDCNGCHTETGGDKAPGRILAP